MGEVGLGGVALYNPQLLAKHELKREFVVRTEELARLVADLRSRYESTPQHHLILGQRGMGKTTLLHRLAFAIADDEELRATYFPLVFPEEQYNIRGLGDFWLNCLDALSNMFERWDLGEEAARVDAVIAGLSRDDESLESRGRTALLEQAKRMDRRLVLLIDNVDMLFARLGDADWSFREVLQSSNDLVVIGASTVALEATLSYDAAFYDFFDITRLRGLDREDTQRLLAALAERTGKDRVRVLASEHPERVEPIRTLSGGNLRTIAALFDLLATDGVGNVRLDLESLLDRYTPVYTARMDALSPQAQTVMDAVCRRWDPVTAADLAADTGLGVNSVSAQLDRLVTAGVIEKVRQVDAATGVVGKRLAFQVAERFFNIWYLMRAGRRSRQRLLWFVRFLEALYGPRVLYTHAGRLALDVRAGKVADLDLGIGLLDRLKPGAIKSQLLLTLAANANATELDLLADVAENDHEKGLLAAAARLREARATLEDLHPDSELLERFLNNPVPPWETKLYALNNPDLLPAIGATFEWLEIIAEWCEGEMPQFIRSAVSSGLDVLDPLVERVSRPLTAKRKAELACWREVVKDVRQLSPSAYALAITGFTRWREWTALAPLGVGASAVAIAERRDWVILPHMALLAPESAAADALVRKWLPLAAEEGAFTCAEFFAFRPAARLGLSARVRDRMDRVGLTQIWRPAREALHAAALGTTDVLEALAPELRAAALALYAEWLDDEPISVVGD